MKELIEVKEGLVRLKLPPQALKPLGERKPKPPVFYNPEAVLNRDVAVLVVRTLSKAAGEGLRVCDALAGCGVRGLRFLAEGLGVKEAVLNDLNPDAVRFIQLNTEINGLSGRVEIYNLDARVLLLERKVRLQGFDFVDIDPFGSPASFVQSAVLSLKPGGVLAATATDTAPLSGTYPRVCLRRYWARPLKTEYYPEVAVRILLGFIARNCTTVDRGLEPILVHRTTQYIRVYARVHRGVKTAEETMNKMGYLNHCFRCLHRFFVDLDTPPGGKCPNCGDRLSWAGPLWMGRIFDADFCHKLREEYITSHLSSKRELGRLIEAIDAESRGAATYYVTDRVSSLLKASPPAKNIIIENLRKMGYTATPTHFDGKGFRTDAPIRDIIMVFKKTSGSSKPTP
ncbi:MAG: N2,N2-dimethylguanosine tRNA methyltransferase [Candidatus Bathyarchaeota archaeon B24]|nr:MAG: N2,N2-dimethylguanosine tRNA methyltransferase [Candidatus Bathyarchaeota archaeon B24]